MPQNLEREDLAVVFEEGVEVLVWTATLEHDLYVILLLSKIRRSLLHVNHSAGLLEGIIGVTFTFIERNAFVTVERFREVITVNDTENSSIDVQIHSEVQISPSVRLAVSSWNLVTFQKHSLRNARVLDPVFQNVDSVVIKIVEEHTLPDPVILIRIFNDRFLEEAVEFEHLPLG